MTIYTIGHSTRTIEDFIALLQAHGIVHLGDIRTVPKSRRHPHFAGEALARSLSEAGIAYRHFGALGGLRKPRADSRNTAWRHEGFRGYADYMETPAFEQARDALIAWAERPTAVMCAEALWWQCHRRLLADVLTARGIDVRHIMSASTVAPHELTEFARVETGNVRYPGLI
jgi:uncharacterized protein (DUF488 family)